MGICCTWWSVSVGTLYAGANDANTVAWNNSNSSSSVHEVATKKANELGLYDMTW
jgi:hypothetical protein